MAKEIQFPIGELFWVEVSGDGVDVSDDENVVKMKKKASLRMDAKDKDAIRVMGELDAAWKEYKGSMGLPAGKKPKSLGYKMVEDKETGEETGEVEFYASTNSFFKSGKPAKVPIYDAKGVEMDNSTEIGHGSIGTIYAEAAGYDFNKKAYGITLYLKAVQVIPSKLKERGSTVTPRDMSEYGDETDAEGPRDLGREADI